MGAELKSDLKTITYVEDMNSTAENIIVLRSQVISIQEDCDSIVNLLKDVEEEVLAGADTIRVQVDNKIPDIVAMVSTMDSMA